MKKIAYFAGGVAVAASMATIATSLTVPHSFESGATISSAEMNANFDAVKNAVDDNDSRITALESNCPADMVPVGSICVDIYEASVWDADTGGTQITDLGDCAANGSDCTGIYARSEAEVMPATSITWFQAQQACANVGKRLLTNAEWQLAATGTDAAVCNISGVVGVANTNGHPECKSTHGVINMAGNVNEWVADWVIRGGDFGSAGADAEIRAVYRGGGQGGGDIFSYNAVTMPTFTGVAHGFRCAK